MTISTPAAAAGAAAAPGRSSSSNNQSTNVVVNGLSKTAIMGIKEKMRASPEMGVKADICIEAVWSMGVVRGTGAADMLVCHAPPEIQILTNAGHKQYPSIYAFCPLVSAGCFSLIFMMQAAERGVQFDSYETNMSAKPDMSCFYKKSALGKCPWGADGVYLDIRITGPATQHEIDMLGHLADEHCPSVEVMRREFPVDVEIKTKQMKKRGNKMAGADDNSDSGADLDDHDGNEQDGNKEDTVPFYYDMEKYHAIAREEAPHIVKQSARGEWFCHNESRKYPDALMAFQYARENGTVIPMSHDKPISSGKYASPAQLCFFGGLSTHMHTIAVRLYARGYKVNKMRGKILTRMNKRAVMGVDQGKYVFPSGCEMIIKLESDAPKKVVRQVQLEAEEMSPALMNWGHSIPLQLRILKEADDDATEYTTGSDVMSMDSSAWSDASSRVDEQTKAPGPFASLSSGVGASRQGKKKSGKGWNNFLKRFDRMKKKTATK